MKKILASLSLVLVAVLGVVGFSACKKNSLVGTWVQVHAISYYENGEVEYEMNQQQLEENALDVTIVLKKNGKGTYTMQVTKGDWETYDITWKKTKKGCAISFGEGDDMNFELKKGNLVNTFTYADGFHEYTSISTFKKAK